MPEMLLPMSRIARETCLASDSDFDKIYDAKSRKLSRQHWTPVWVAKRVARLLTEAGATRILDVGSGVGKFCIAGALSTGADFVGLERRSGLVDIARSAASELGATRATFVHADVDSFSFEGFDGIYLYNPFQEQISKFIVQIDDEVERSQAAYWHFVRATTAELAHLSTRAAVVTFNGFGGQMPPDYEFFGDEPAGNDRLELWVKQ